MTHVARHAGAVLAAFALFACAGRGEPEPPRAPPISAESPPDREPEPAVAAPPIAVEPPPEPAPAVTVAHTVDRYGHVSLSLANRSESTTRVALRVLVEREGAAGELTVADDLGSFELEGPSAGDGCAELLSGAELREIWGCLRGDARGEGHVPCAPAPAGRYRFVARSCDGRSRTEGAVFSYP